MNLMRLYLKILFLSVIIFSCQKEIHFDADNPPGNEPPPVDTTISDAQYTLVNTPNECMIDSVAGYFVKGVETDSSFCKIFIGVNVTKAGRYTITTDEKNGYSFSGIGVFENTGTHSVILYAQGTPGKAEADVFNVSTGTSSCSFNIDVLDAVAVTSDDYFPLTKGSYWSYEDLTQRGDTMTREIMDTNNVNDLVYTVMEERKRGPAKSYLFRETRGGEFFEFASVDKYAGGLSYVPAVYDEIYFMNQVLFDGTTWESTEYTGTISGGQPILLKYGYTCLQKNAVVVLNGKAFMNVYIVNVRPQIRSVDHGYNSNGQDYYYYYAKGVGIIYMLMYDLGRLQTEWRIKAWDVK
jgi:hypothetical protein